MSKIYTLPHIPLSEGNLRLCSVVASAVASVDVVVVGVVVVVVVVVVFAVADNVALLVVICFVVYIMLVAIVSSTCKLFLKYRIFLVFFYLLSILSI